MKNSAFLRLSGESDSQYVDIYTVYGISFIKGEYLKLISKAASKGYVSNNSRLQHGIQMLAKPEYAKYASRTISLQILLEANSASEYVTRIEAFTDKISQGLVFLKIPSRHRVFKLVYNDMRPKAEFRNNRATFTLEMTEPNVNDRITI